MSDIEDRISFALEERGIAFSRPLEPISDQYKWVRTDRDAVVVKGKKLSACEEAIHDLILLHEAGVDAERLLVGEVITISHEDADLYYIVTGFLAPDRPVRAGDAFAVGQLVRAVHDAYFETDQGGEEAWVFHDFFARNIIWHDGRPHLVDVGDVEHKTRIEAMNGAFHDFASEFSPFRPSHSEFMRGYGDFGT